jgi:hypothetical protein
MIFTHDHINFYISQTFSFGNDFGAFFKGTQFWDYTSVIFTIYQLTPSPELFEVLVNFFIAPILLFVTKLRFPNPLIQPLMTKRAFPALFTLDTYSGLHLSIINRLTACRLISSVKRTCFGFCWWRSSVLRRALLAT